MSATANDTTTLQPLTELRKQLDPLYWGISSIIRQLKESKRKVPKELKELQDKCTTLDRKIEDLSDDPAVDTASIGQEVDSLQAHVATAVAPFKQ